MKEEMQSWFQGVGYEEGFDQCEVTPIKFNMFYSLADAQGILVVLNTRTCSSASAPTSTPYPTPPIEVSDHMLKVDHLVDVTYTLKMRDLDSPPISTKRAGEEEQQYPRTKAFLQNGLEL
ncbi:unnamed protein product [Vicia faba]|uniref:Uncharacterized protein n=1 Tax=Vicia faba TaxID=3906 RepID=A0AAV1B2V3_VICFA|nr:unnamed protein product [Vicia faba]